MPNNGQGTEAAAATAGATSSEDSAAAAGADAGATGQEESIADA